MASIFLWCHLDGSSELTWRESRERSRKIATRLPSSGKSGTPSRSPSGWKVCCWLGTGSRSDSGSLHPSRIAPLGALGKRTYRAVACLTWYSSSDNSRCLRSQYSQFGRLAQVTLTGYCRLECRAQSEAALCLASNLCIGCHSSSASVETVFGKTGFGTWTWLRLASCSRLITDWPATRKSCCQVRRRDRSPSPSCSEFAWGWSLPNWNHHRSNFRCRWMSLVSSIPTPSQIHQITLGLWSKKITKKLTTYRLGQFSHMEQQSCSNFTDTCWHQR